MKKFRLWRIPAALALALAAHGLQAEPAAQPRQVRVWVEDALIKILPDAAPPAELRTELKLAGPRGGLTAGQVVIRAERPLEKVEIALAPLVDAGNRALPAVANFVGYVPIKGEPFMTPPEELLVDASAEVRHVPDPLLPEPVVSVPAGRGIMTGQGEGDTL